MKRYALLGMSAVCLIVLGTLTVSGWLERNPVAGAMLSATLFFMLLGTPSTPSIIWRRSVRGLNLV